MAEPTTRRGIDLAPDSLPAGGRIPPQALDVEEQILGAMLLEKEAIARVFEVLDYTAFHADRNRKIFQAIARLFEKGEPVDSITLGEELRRSGDLDAAGGEAYLVDLTMKVSSTANVEYHARIVLEKALMRSLIAESGKIAERAFQPTEDAFDLLDQAEQAIFRISESRMKRNFVDMER